MIFRRNFHPFFERFPFLSPRCREGKKYSEGTDAKHRIRSCSVQHRIKPKPARISNIWHRISNIDRARLNFLMQFLWFSWTSFTVPCVGLVDVGLTFLKLLPQVLKNPDWKSGYQLNLHNIWSAYITPNKAPKKPSSIKVWIHHSIHPLFGALSVNCYESSYV